ncbi:basic proline-rich protein-like [Formica exsecta]|uniref:basic proline-rich protein-like n=1 Tax=Formica exsecta TaxID=72781 RepID=UPI0011448D47|nr:basic proline-rich protein-like [Formica exsecta]
MPTEDERRQLVELFGRWSEDEEGEFPNGPGPTPVTPPRGEPPDRHRRPAPRVGTAIQRGDADNRRKILLLSTPPPPPPDRRRAPRPASRPRATRPNIASCAAAAPPPATPSRLRRPPTTEAGAINGTKDCPADPSPGTTTTEPGGNSSRHRDGDKGATPRGPPSPSPSPVDSVGPMDLAVQRRRDPPK